VQNFVSNWGLLTLEVAEDQLLYDEAEVYSRDATRDNLAFLLFRDGVRSIAFHPEVDMSELSALAECLSHADDLADAEHDLVTAFWEQDFSHIDYKVADPFLGGEVLAEGMIDSLRETVIRRLQESEIPSSPAEALKPDRLLVVDTAEIRGQDVSLSFEEIAERERAVEDLSAVLDDFTQVILELTADTPEISLDDRLGQSLRAILEAYLHNQDYRSIASLLQTLYRWETQGRCPSGFLGEVVGATFTSAHLKDMVSAIGKTRDNGDIDMLAFVTAIRRWTTKPLLEVLGDEEDRARRKSLIEILEAEGGVAWEDLQPFIEDERWYVVRNTVQLSASCRHPELLQHAQRLLGHSDVRVRRETLRAIERSGNPLALQCFARALSDPEPSVRTLAARALGREGSRDQEAIVRMHVEERNLGAISTEEAEALLVAYAELAQERAIPLLDGLWRKKMLANKPIQLRISVLRALGSIRHASARHILTEATKSGEAQIQRAAVGALQLQMVSGGERN
jgi:HEAT repeat protein